MKTDKAAIAAILRRIITDKRARRYREGFADIFSPVCYFA